MISLHHSLVHVLNKQEKIFNVKGSDEESKGWAYFGDVLKLYHQSSKVILFYFI
jgi:hypothetical protein